MLPQPPRLGVFRGRENDTGSVSGKAVGSCVERKKGMGFGDLE